MAEKKVYIVEETIHINGYPMIPSEHWHYVTKGEILSLTEDILSHSWEDMKKLAKKLGRKEYHTFFRKTPYYSFWVDYGYGEFKVKEKNFKSLAITFNFKEVHCPKLIDVVQNLKAKEVFEFFADNRKDNS